MLHKLILFTLEIRLQIHDILMFKLIELLYTSSNTRNVDHNTNVEMSMP